MKDYLKWSKIKMSVNNTKDRPYFYEKEIWFCYMGENIGYEEDGKGEEFIRPVIIFKKFNNSICLAIPTSTKIRNTKYYFKFKINDKENVAILSQIKTIDIKRLKYKFGKIENSDFTELKEKIKTLLF